MCCRRLKPDVLDAQSCPTLRNPTDCSPPGSSIHGIFHARILECIALPFSRGSSWPGDGTEVSCIAGRFFTVWATIIWSTCSYFRIHWCLTPSAPNFRSWGWKTGLEPAFHREEELEVPRLPEGLEEEAGVRSLGKSPTQGRKADPGALIPRSEGLRAPGAFSLLLKYWFAQFCSRRGTFPLAGANASLLSLKPQRLLCRAVGWRVWTVWSQLVACGPACLFV